jgi:hypothetical protein
MYNWSVDTKRLKQNHEAFEVFQLEQMINFGLNDQKLSEKSLRKYWDRLNIDEYKRRFLKNLLWSSN